MLCAHPLHVVNSKDPVRCGQCMPCRISRRQEWATRIVLESYLHPPLSCWFVTLTYNQESLPQGGSLVPRDLKLFLMRVRRSYGKSFRYFAVGEYGDISMRPHYHFVCYGFTDVKLAQVGNKMVLVSKIFEKAWTNDDGSSKGFIHIGIVNDQSAGYVAGYCVKKLTGKADIRLGGRQPEFSRMSRNPGIGAGVVMEIAKHVTPKMIVEGKFPEMVRIGGKKRQLGRYMLEKIKLVTTGDPRSKSARKADRFADLGVEMNNRAMSAAKGRHINSIQKSKRTI